MIGAVHLRVAVCTALSEQESRRRATCKAISIVRDTRVSGLRVAALTKQRRTFRQHARVIRAVWCMAERAVLADRCMLPQVGSAFLGMALLARVVDAESRELRRGVVTVHVVAAQAFHLSFQDRVRKGLARFTALHLMAGEADVGLRRRLPHGIDRRMMKVVTVGTSHLVTGVCAGVPTETDVVLVAGQTHAVLFFDRRVGFQTEAND